MCGRRAVLVVGLLTLNTACTAVAPDSIEEGKTKNATQRIDTLLARAWRADGLEPAETASDAEFVRRVYLDLTGCVPQIGETQSFLGSTQADRRARLIDELLQRPSHAEHLADEWARILLPEDSSLIDFVMKEAFRNWLSEALWTERGFDTIVSELLLATSGRDEGPTYFYMAGTVTPAALAARTTSSLLGVQLECAECHDHPFAAWRREDFWSFAAFFSDLRWRKKLNAGEVLDGYLEDFEGPALLLPGTEKVMLPRFLKGGQAVEQDGQTRRQVLAAWFVSAENPYFARSTVNRVWAMLCGDPLVESVDDGKAAASGTRVAILDELTKYFITSRFDMRELVRVVANTQAYQATSKSQDNGAGDDLFRRMHIKSLSSEQLYASLNSVLEEPYYHNRPVEWGLAIDLDKMAALRRMPLGPADTVYHGEVYQALTMLNGETLAAATDWKRNPLLKSLLESKLDDEKRVAYIFLAAIARTPTASESRRCVAHLQETGTSAGRGRALGDILWALLNTAEFTLNH